MTLYDLIEQYHYKEEEAYRANDLIAKQATYEFLNENIQMNRYYDFSSYYQALLKLYFRLKKEHMHNDLDDIFKCFNANFSTTIHNCIYSLLNIGDDLEYVDPYLWPGIVNITMQGDTYILDTYKGKVYVKKASDMFSKSNSSHIFEEQLVHMCYDRTYDFLRENNDYNAVLAYNNNFFFGGHYHAYLQKKSEILDIASNAYYTLSDSSDIVLSGTIIKTLSFDEVEKEYEKVKKTMPEIEEMSKLQVLTLYYDRLNEKTYM